MWPFSTPSRRTRADFEREVLPHTEALFAAALRLTRNAADAEDLTQETVLRAWRFFHQFEAGTNARAWLYKILHNAFATRYRRGTREREVAEAAAIEEAHTAAPASELPPQSGAPVGDDVQRALDALPEEFRTVVLLCDLEEMSYREIAEIVGCPVGTVMSRLHRGRQRLQAALRSYAEAEGVIRGGAPGEARDNVVPLRRGS